MKLKKSMQISLCGLLAAIMIVVMLLGSIVPFASILCPALAGLFMVPVIRECGSRLSFILFLGVSMLSLLLIPDKEIALLFTFLFGLYPLLRLYMDKIHPHPLRIVIKLLLCNLLLLLVYSLLFFVISPALFQAKFSGKALWFLIVILVMTNLAFLLYDKCLARITFLYEYKLRNKLFRTIGR